MSDIIDKIRRDQERSQERASELHQKEREVLFENEALVVKILQAVSGAAMIGGLSQAETLSDWAGKNSFLIFLTALGLALISSVFCAHWKHQYKMWNVKALVEKNVKEKEVRHTRSNRYLSAMRIGMWVSLLLIAFGFLQLLVFLWIKALA